MVATILESAGHRVTALDMAACGASAACIEEVRSFEEYSRPLLDAVAALPPGEKAVLVGHSFGGQSLAPAMERYSDKVAVAVFISAAMPAAGKPMAFVLEQVRRTRPWWGLLDGRPCVFSVDFTRQTMTIWTTASFRKKRGQISSWTARTEPAAIPRIQRRHFCSDHSTWLRGCISSVHLRQVLTTATDFSSSIEMRSSSFRTGLICDDAGPDLGKGDGEAVTASAVPERLGDEGRRRPDGGSVRRGESTSWPRRTRPGRPSSSDGWRRGTPARW
jgi:hypothetical protein